MAALALSRYGTSALIKTVLHPFGYAKLLMQLGHEPMAPEVSDDGKKNYPNIFKYIRHIKQEDGFFGMYRGVLPCVIHGTLEKMVQIDVQDQFDSLKKPEKSAVEDETEPEDDLVTWFGKLVWDRTETTIVRFSGIIASRPFHVIMVRSMAQFVGKETQYSTVLSSIGEIFRHDGVLGFFAGLTPCLIGEAMDIWLLPVMVASANRFILKEKTLKYYAGYPFDRLQATRLLFWSRDYVDLGGIVGFIVGYGMFFGMFLPFNSYGLELVSIVMTINNSGLRAAQPPAMPVYTDWEDCLDHLDAEGKLGRGSASFSRPVYGDTSLGESTV